MEECEPCALPVSWDDLYIDDVVTHSDIRFEEAAVLYNIGSMESVLGCKQARSDAEGIKAACTHFMSAAWCFQRVSEVFSGAVAPDLESELMRLKAQMMLAQAQECVFRKSQLDGRKSGINARIAQQLVDFYGQLGSMLSSAGTVAKVIPGRTRKHYSGIFAVKRSFYESQVAYYSAQTAEDTGEYGLRLAWLLKARESLQAAIAANKDLKDSEMRETLNFVQDVIVGKHESAEKDNNLIYHAQIPQTVPEVQSAQLVKPLAFDPAEAAGPDLFKRCEASSVYSEEADPEFYSVSEDAPLPQALYDACAQLSVEGDAAQKRLTQRMQQLASAAVDVDTLLGELRQLTKDAPAETAASLRPFLDDLAKFEKVAREAQPSNDSLRASASRHAESLAELRKSPEELKASLPTVTDLQADEQLGQSVSELKRLLGKVSEMRSQRAELLASIRRHSLLLRQPNQDPVQMFEATLAKQQDRLTYLNQNLPPRQTSSDRSAPRRREAALQRLVATWNEGPVLLDKVQEGVDFFTGLHRKLKVIEARLKPLLTPPKPPQPPPQQQQPQPQQPPPPQLHQYSRSSGQFQSLNPTEGQQKGLKTNRDLAAGSPFSQPVRVGRQRRRLQPAQTEGLPALSEAGTYGSQRSSLPASPHRASADLFNRQRRSLISSCRNSMVGIRLLPSSETTGYQQPAPGSGSFDPQQLHQYPTRFPANQFGSQPPPSSTGQRIQPPPSSTGQFGSQLLRHQLATSPTSTEFRIQPRHQLTSSDPASSDINWPVRIPASNINWPVRIQASDINCSLIREFPSYNRELRKFDCRNSRLEHLAVVFPSNRDSLSSRAPRVSIYQPSGSLGGTHPQLPSVSAQPVDFPSNRDFWLGRSRQERPRFDSHSSNQDFHSNRDFSQQQGSKAGAVPLQPGYSVTGGFAQQPDLQANGGYSQQSGICNRWLLSATGDLRPETFLSNRDLQPQPGSATGWLFLSNRDLRLKRVSSATGICNWVATLINRGSSTGNVSQQPGSATGNFSQQPGSATGNFSQQPGSATGNFSQQPGSATGNFSQQPGSATATFSATGSATATFLSNRDLQPETFLSNRDLQQAGSLSQAALHSAEACRGRTLCTDRASSGASTPQHLPPDGAGGGLAKGSNNNSCRSLLDSAAEDTAAAAAAVLTPSVLTSAERELQVAEAALRKQSGVDKLSDNLLFNQLIADTERLGRRLPVSDAWQQHQAALKGLTAAGGVQQTKKTTTVAMCHPMQNRAPQCVPYDANRVTVGDDASYLNASLLHWQSTRLIFAQQPNKSQLSTFYKMLLQYGCELLCQLGPSVSGLPPYWPDAKGESAVYSGSVEVSVRAVHPGDVGCTERVIAVRVGEASRTLVML
uniref:BRO1 domain-containing protein n=1 Tax=Macrostomum lignano TaxID=282301 RepID=A0A1I8JNF5_9PLAT